MDNISLLFSRPNEPLSVPKGDKSIFFDLPNNKEAKSTVSIEDIYSNFLEPSTTTIDIPNIEIPDVGDSISLARNVQFSTFNAIHRQYASQLISFFMGIDRKNLLFVAAILRDKLNPQLFTYALMTAILHRNDTQDIQLPLLSEIFPDKFVGSQIINQAIKEGILIKPGSRIPIEIPYNFTATDVDPEHRVAYWREDVGVNLFHWHWHLVHPYDGPMEIVKKDRRGELFYYVYHQLLARFNVERLCNNLDLTVPLNIEEFNKPIPEAYFPKLDQTVTGRAWPSRTANMYLSDIDRQSDGVVRKLSDFKTYKSRIDEAIRALKARTTDGSEIILDETTGIDTLGNMIEASPKLSPNFEYYGSLHNFGHDVLAYCHDPNGHHLEPFAIMGDSTTAMRDPVFYRWNAYIGNIFNQYKKQLNSYTKEQLVFDSKIKIKVEEIGLFTKNANPNTINTYWTKSNINLSNGLDFVPQGAILVKLQHLNHDDFQYKITVNNFGSSEVIGTVRIFIAPRSAKDGRKFSFEEQRLLMIEMDKFTTTIKKGKSAFTRSSKDSTLTIPYEASFRDLSKKPEDPEESQVFNYCGCGWPQHMLVPKGTTEGYPMDLFVMITDYEKDKVDQDNPIPCKTGISFCGLKDRKYPDVRSMGFPFDRPATASSLDDFLTPNMAVQPITIRFSDVIKPLQK